MTHKEQRIVIKLSEHFMNSIASRAAIINLFAIDLSKTKKLELDFSNIRFVSRSSTHQLIKEKERLENELHIKVNFANVSEEIEKMFNAVNTSLESPKRATSTIQRVRFSSTKEFQSFLKRI